MRAPHHSQPQSFSTGSYLSSCLWLGAWGGYSYAVYQAEKAPNTKTADSSADGTTVKQLIEQAVSSGDRTQCYKILDLNGLNENLLLSQKRELLRSEMDRCFYELALAHTDPDMCAWIDADSRIEYYRTRDICYSEIAEALNDRSYCGFMSGGAPPGFCDSSPETQATNVFETELQDSSFDGAAIVWETSDYFARHNFLFDYPKGWETAAADAHGRGNMRVYPPTESGESSQTHPSVDLSYGYSFDRYAAESYVFQGYRYFPNLSKNVLVHTRNDTLSYWIDQNGISRIDFIKYQELGDTFISEFMARLKLE